MRGLVCFLLMLFATPALASSFEITIVSSSEETDIRAGTSFAGITVKPQRSVSRSVELAVFESSTLFEALGIDVSISEVELTPDADIRAQLERIPSAALVILDLPLGTMKEVALVADQLKLVSVNVRHSDSELRDSLCLPNVYHAIPSDRMYFDALGQFLIYRGWRKVLLVLGSSERDLARATSLRASLEKFGATIVDQRVFTLSHHPDDRDENNPEFLTGGVSYDAVAVIDSNTDYGRYLQYSTRSPRPVVGDVGLTPVSWHFALERYGAPQLNERYREFKQGEPLDARVAMTDAEFAAWSAVKLVSNSLNTRENPSDLNVRAIYSDPASQVDLYKGTRGSVRRWNHQFRQPILLATPDAVIALAPLPKFLHPEHYVDTLGLDAPESECQLDSSSR